MHVLIAPDSFKGSLSASEAAARLAAGWQKARPDDELALVPIADGGEGTLDALVAAWQGRIEFRDVVGPLGETVRARFGLTPDGRTAIVEMAEASGLLLVPPDRRNPCETTTYGTGQLIGAALDRGVEQVLVAVGGSATNDGGAGMAQALGVALLDATGAPLPPGGAGLARLARIDGSGLHPRVADVQFVVASDVDNPLVGPQGATAVFGPQKGAGPDDVVRLDAALAHYAKVVEDQWPGLPLTSGPLAEQPGAGAAGGLAFGLVAFLGATMRRGADVVLDAVDMDAHLAWADVVLTGEGRLDGQSARGKAPVALARRGANLEKPVIAIAGALDPDGQGLHRLGISAALAIAPGPADVKTSIQQAGPWLEARAEQVARLVDIGYRLAKG